MAGRGRRSHKNFHVILSRYFRRSQPDYDAWRAVGLVARAEKKLGDRGYASTSDRREMVTTAMHSSAIGRKSRSTKRQRLSPPLGPSRPCEKSVRREVLGRPSSGSGHVATRRIRNACFEGTERGEDMGWRWTLKMRGRLRE